jgi:hypothetical protein
MRPIAIVAALVAVPLVSGCALLGRDQAAFVAPDMPGQLESIHAAAVTRDLAVFWVSSNGCTGKDDLQPVISGTGDASIITLRRISEDRCDTPLDEGVEVIWSFEELGLKPGTPLSVNNPYQLPHT